MNQEHYQLICRAQAEYARAIDSDQLEQWPDFFEADCFYKVTTADNHRRGMEAGLIWADSRGMLTDRVTSLRDANIYERHAYRHILGQPYVVEADGSAVRAETSFIVVRIMRDGSTDLFASGVYHDLYALRDGAAKLKERIVVCDSSRTDTLLALPL